MFPCRTRGQALGCRRLLAPYPSLLSPPPPLVATRSQSYIDQYLRYIIRQFHGMAYSSSVPPAEPRTFPPRHPPTPPHRVLSQIDVFVALFTHYPSFQDPPLPRFELLVDHRQGVLMKRAAGGLDPNFRHTFGRPRAPWLAVSSHRTES